MKKVFTLLFAVAISMGSMAQGNGNGKSNGKLKVKTDKQKVKLKEKKKDHDDDVYNTGQTSASKNSKNQPAKVRSAFLRDYPNATNVVWSKYQGDWTATFNNGLLRTTVVYHANGERRDTRTSMNRSQLPGNDWNGIFKRDRVYPTGNVIRIQSPGLGSEIFRIASQLAGAKTQYVYYDASGQKVQYDY